MKAAAPLAGGLYPIIRRVRRPFIVQDDDAGSPPAPPPVTQQVETVVSYTKARSEKERVKRAPGEAKD